MALSFPEQRDHLSSLSRLSYPFTCPFFNGNFYSNFPKHSYFLHDSRQLVHRPEDQLQDKVDQEINFVKSFIYGPRLFIFKLVPKNLRHTHTNLYLNTVSIIKEENNGDNSELKKKTLFLLFFSSIIPTCHKRHTNAYLLLITQIHIKLFDLYLEYHYTFFKLQSVEFR